MSAENTPQTNIPDGRTRTLKIIRWILLPFLLIAIQLCVVAMIPFNGPYTQFRIFVFIAMQGFIPGLFMAPVACIVAPSHKRKAAMLTCAFFILLIVIILFSQKEPWFPYDYSSALSLIVQYAGIVGLLVGYFIVLFALKKQNTNGLSAPKKATLLFIIILCIASASLFFQPKYKPAYTVESTETESQGVVSYSLKMENKGKEPLHLTGTLTAMRVRVEYHYQSQPIRNDGDSPPIQVGATQTEVTLAPYEHKEITGQFILSDTTTPGALILIPHFTKDTFPVSNTTGTTSPSK